MAILLKQSTASQEVLLGPFLDDTDGKTAETGLTIANTDIKIWKNGGTSEASKNSGGATHIASGRYYAVLDATDTDTLGPLEINVHVSGALPVRRECLVLAANVYDALVAASDKLQVHADEITAGLITAAAIAADAITAAKVAADVSAEIADAVWDEALSGHATAGSTGEALSDAGAGGTPPSEDDIADAVWSRPTSNYEAAVKANPMCAGAAVMAAVHKTRDNAGTLEIADSSGNYAGANALSRAITTDSGNEPIDELGTIS